MCYSKVSVAGNLRSTQVMNVVHMAGNRDGVATAASGVLLVDSDGDDLVANESCKAARADSPAPARPFATRPARSNFEPWHGQKKPPLPSRIRDGSGVTTGKYFGEQPRCVHRPMYTPISGRRERHSFFAYFGCWSRSESGSARLASSFGSVSSDCGRAIENEYRLAAPCRNRPEHFARIQARKIDR